jgi:hypothetical protein
METSENRTQNIHNSSTHSHPSEEENRTKNRSQNCKCKRALMLPAYALS